MYCRLKKNLTFQLLSFSGVLYWWMLLDWLTHSMQHSPSWQANRFCSLSRNSPHFMEPRKIRYLIHKCPAICTYPEPAQSSPCPPTSHFLEIHLNIILPSTPGSPKWSPTLRFPHQNSVHASPLPHTRYMSRPSHYSGFYNPNNIWWGIQIIKLLIM